MFSTMQLRFSFNITVVFSGSSSIIVRGARPSTPPTKDNQSVLHLELLVDGDAYKQRAVVIVLPAAMFHCWLNDTTVEVTVLPLPAPVGPRSGGGSAGSRQCHDVCPVWGRGGRSGRRDGAWPPTVRLRAPRHLPRALPVTAVRCHRSASATT